MMLDDKRIDRHPPLSQFLDKGRIVVVAGQWSLFTQEIIKIREEEGRGRIVAQDFRHTIAIKRAHTSSILTIFFLSFPFSLSKGRIFSLVSRNRKKVENLSPFDPRMKMKTISGLNGGV